MKTSEGSSLLLNLSPPLVPVYSATSPTPQTYQLSEGLARENCYAVEVDGIFQLVHGKHSMYTYSIHQRTKYTQV
jgi:hypothetical protein